MKEFIEKYKTNSKYKAKVQLIFYTSFVVIVSVFALSTRGNVVPTNTLDVNQSYTENGKLNNKINVPTEYDYTKNITINNKNYQYKGTVEENKEMISKTIDDITTNYIYQENGYYQKENDNYILTTKENVYDIVSPNYLKLETINQYLSKAKKENNQYKVYLKDIILAHESENYITIAFDENKINIDYTSLMKLFDKNIENFIVEIIIEEKE